MRMSDWSSDVCSSDLARQRLPHDGIAGQALIARQVLPRRAQGDAQAVLDAQRAALPDRLVVRAHQRVPRAFVPIGRASCRERVCPYVWISVVPVSLITKIHTRLQPSTLHIISI